MGTLAWAVVAACLVAVCVVLLVAVRLNRTSADQRAARVRLEDELARSRAAVDALAHRVDTLGHEVATARAAVVSPDSAHAASRPDREFVITSLVQDHPEHLSLAPAVQRPAAPATAETTRTARVSGSAVATALEDRVVDAIGHSLAARPDSGVAQATARFAVRAVALGHGVRRALSPDVLDRAAAEATVARRRSRRDRRRDLRHAQRAVRAVRTSTDLGAA